MLFNQFFHAKKSHFQDNKLNPLHPKDNLNHLRTNSLKENQISEKFLKKFSHQKFTLKNFSKKQPIFEDKDEESNFYKTQQIADPKRKIADEQISNSTQQSFMSMERFNETTNTIFKLRSNRRRQLMEMATKINHGPYRVRVLQNSLKINRIKINSSINKQDVDIQNCNIPYQHYSSQQLKTLSQKMEFIIKKNKNQKKFRNKWFYDQEI